MVHLQTLDTRREVRCIRKACSTLEDSHSEYFVSPFIKMLTYSIVVMVLTRKMN